MRDRFDAIAAPLRERGRVTTRPNWHLTLLFLGDVDTPRRARIEHAAATIATTPITLRLDRCGYWPKPQIAWLGGTAPPALLQLTSALRGAARACGLSRDERAYFMHVTLARRVVAPPQFEPIKPVEWTPASFGLIASINAAAGPQYSVLTTWPLSPARRDAGEGENADA